MKKSTRIIWLILLLGVAGAVGYRMWARQCRLKGHAGKEHGGATHEHGGREHGGTEQR